MSAISDDLWREEAQSVLDLLPDAFVSEQQGLVLGPVIELLSLPDSDLRLAGYTEAVVKLEKLQTRFLQSRAQSFSEVMQSFRVISERLNRLSSTVTTLKRSGVDLHGLLSSFDMDEFIACFASLRRKSAIASLLTTLREILDTTHAVEAAVASGAFGAAVAAFSELPRLITHRLSEIPIISSAAARASAAVQVARSASTLVVLAWILQRAPLPDIPPTITIDAAVRCVALAAAGSGAADAPVWGHWAGGPGPHPAAAPAAGAAWGAASAQAADASGAAPRLGRRVARRPILTTARAVVCPPAAAVRDVGLRRGGGAAGAAAGAHAGDGDRGGGPYPTAGGQAGGAAGAGSAVVGATAQPGGAGAASGAGGNIGGAGACFSNGGSEVAALVAAAEVVRSLRGAMVAPERVAVFADATPVPLAAAHAAIRTLSLVQSHANVSSALRPVARRSVLPPLPWKTGTSVGAVVADTARCFRYIVAAVARHVEYSVAMLDAHAPRAFATDDAAVLSFPMTPTALDRCGRALVSATVAIATGGGGRGVGGASDSDADGGDGVRRGGYGAGAQQSDAVRLILSTAGRACSAAGHADRLTRWAAAFPSHRSGTAPARLLALRRRVATATVSAVPALEAALARSAAAGCAKLGGEELRPDGSADAAGGGSGSPTATTVASQDDWKRSSAIDAEAAACPVCAAFAEGALLVAMRLHLTADIRAASVAADVMPAVEAAAAAAATVVRSIVPLAVGVSERSGWAVNGSSGGGAGNVVVLRVGAAAGGADGSAPQGPQGGAGGALGGAAAGGTAGMTTIAQGGALGAALGAVGALGGVGPVYSVQLRSMDAEFDFGLRGAVGGVTYQKGGKAGGGGGAPFQSGGGAGGGTGGGAAGPAVGGGGPRLLASAMLQSDPVVFANAAAPAEAPRGSAAAAAAAAAGIAAGAAGGGGGLDPLRTATASAQPGALGALSALNALGALGGGDDDSFAILSPVRQASDAAHVAPLVVVFAMLLASTDPRAPPTLLRALVAPWVEETVEAITEAARGVMRPLLDARGGRGGGAAGGGGAGGATVSALRLGAQCVQLIGAARRSLLAAAAGIDAAVAVSRPGAKPADAAAAGGGAASDASRSTALSAIDAAAAASHAMRPHSDAAAAARLPRRLATCGNLRADTRTADAVLISAGTSAAASGGGGGADGGIGGMWGGLRGAQVARALSSCARASPLTPTGDGAGGAEDGMDGAHGSIGCATAMRLLLTRAALQLAMLIDEVAGGAADAAVIFGSSVLPHAARAAWSALNETMSVLRTRHRLATAAASASMSVLAAAGRASGAGVGGGEYAAADMGGLPSAPAGGAFPFAATAPARSLTLAPLSAPALALRARMLWRWERVRPPPPWLVRDAGVVPPSGPDARGDGSMGGDDDEDSVAAPHPLSSVYVSAFTQIVLAAEDLAAVLREVIACGYAAAHTSPTHTPPLGAAAAIVVAAADVSTSSLNAGGHPPWPPADAAAAAVATNVDMYPGVGVLAVTHAVVDTLSFGVVMALGDHIRASASAALAALRAPPAQIDRHAAPDARLEALLTDQPAPGGDVAPSMVVGALLEAMYRVDEVEVDPTGLTTDVIPPMGAPGVDTDERGGGVGAASATPKLVEGGSVTARFLVATSTRPAFTVAADVIADGATGGAPLCVFLDVVRDGATSLLAALPHHAESLIAPLVGVVVATTVEFSTRDDPLPAAAITYAVLDALSRLTAVFANHSILATASTTAAGGGAARKEPRGAPRSLRLLYSVRHFVQLLLGSATDALAFVSSNRDAIEGSVFSLERVDALVARLAGGRTAATKAAVDRALLR